MRALWLFAVLAGCWTGAVAEDAPVNRQPPPANVHPSQLRVRLERTACDGNCPVYSVEIDAARRVARWVSKTDVGGAQHLVHVSPAELSELDRAIAKAQFFERDDRGALPLKPECTNDGTSTTCSIGTRFSICSDSPHAIITVMKGPKSHTVDYDYCNETTEVDELAGLITRIARVTAGDE